MESSSPKVHAGLPKGSMYLDSGVISCCPAMVCMSRKAARSRAVRSRIQSLKEGGFRVSQVASQLLFHRSAPPWMTLELALGLYWEFK